MSYSVIKPEEFDENVFHLIDKDWFLMTAEHDGVVNPMTVAWATMGILWQRPVVICAVRPERYTHEIASQADTFSLTVFDKQYRKVLGFCGTKSGRDFDKDKETGLTPRFDDVAPYYEQARLVFLCRKLYRQDLEEGCFLDRDAFEKNYPQKDLHRMFIGEIVKVLEQA